MLPYNHILPPLQPELNHNIQPRLAIPSKVPFAPHSNSQRVRGAFNGTGCQKRAQTLKAIPGSTLLAFFSVLYFQNFALSTFSDLDSISTEKIKSQRNNWKQSFS